MSQSREDKSHENILSREQFESAMKMQPYFIEGSPDAKQIELVIKEYGLAVRTSSREGQAEGSQFTVLTEYFYKCPFEYLGYPDGIKWLNFPIAFNVLTGLIETPWMPSTFGLVLFRDYGTPVASHAFGSSIEKFRHYMQGHYREFAGLDPLPEKPQPRPVEELKQEVNASTTYAPEKVHPASLLFSTMFRATKRESIIESDIHPAAYTP